MKRAEHQPETLGVTVYAGVFIKTWRVPDVDTIVPQHSHQYPHTTLIIQGMVRVWRDDVHIGDFMAPATVRIPKHCKHAFRTLTPACVFACIHAEGTEDAVHEEHTIEMED